MVGVPLRAGDLRRGDLALAGVFRRGDLDLDLDALRRRPHFGLPTTPRTDVWHTAYGLTLGDRRFTALTQRQYLAAGEFPDRDRDRDSLRFPAGMNDTLGS